MKGYYKLYNVKHFKTLSNSLWPIQAIVMVKLPWSKTELKTQNFQRKV